LNVAWDFHPVTLRLTWAVTITESAWTIAISAITTRSTSLSWGAITAWWTRVSAVTALASSRASAITAWWGAATAISITSRSAIFTLFEAA
jgi:hypothetical protein